MSSFTPASVIPRKGAQEADVRESERGADRSKKAESVCWHSETAVERAVPV